jgi:hypothetical protein
MKPAAGGAIADVPAALRFALAHGVDVAIPGMDRMEQVDKNTSVGEVPRDPTEKEIAALKAEKELWGDRFCRRCAYCMPCPNGLQIPFLLLIEAYYTRYGLKKWALERLCGLEKKYADCCDCGECTKKCPYELPIAQMMAKAKDEVI